MNSSAWLERATRFFGRRRAHGWISGPMRREPSHSSDRGAQPLACAPRLPGLVKWGVP
jgi:hypothetical protein